MQLLPFFAFMADINVQSQGFFLLYWRAHKKEPLFIRQLPRHKVSNRIQAGLQDKTYLPHLIFLETHNISSGLQTKMALDARQVLKWKSYSMAETGTEMPSLKACKLKIKQ